MPEANVVPGSPSAAAFDLDKAYELGKLSGEVRILKWGVGVALVAILGVMGVLYDEIRQIRDSNDAISETLTGVKTNVEGLEEKVEGLEEKVEGLEEQVAAIGNSNGAISETLTGIKINVESLEEKVAAIEKGGTWPPELADYFSSLHRSLEP